MTRLGYHLLRATPWGMMRLVRQLTAWRLHSPLTGPEELRIPVLYLVADQDHLVPSVEQATLMASLTPRATMRVLAGHGHICLIAPDLDLDAILDEWMTSGADLRETGDTPSHQQPVPSVAAPAVRGWTAADRRRPSRRASRKTPLRRRNLRTRAEGGRPGSADVPRTGSDRPDDVGTPHALPMVAVRRPGRRR